MNIMTGMLAAVLAVHCAISDGPQLSASRKWTPASYHGLVIGKSKKTDVLKTLGKPQFIGKEQDTGLPIMNYAVADPVEGTMTVYIRRGLLDGMSLSPKTQMTRDNIIKILGPDYLVVRYATDNCLGDGGASPIYENPDGSIEHLEFRHRGLAVLLQNNEVEAILFVSKPFGPARSRCGTKRSKS